MLGTSAPRHHYDSDEELLGAPAEDKSKASGGIINEDMASIDELLNQLVASGPMAIAPRIPTATTPLRSSRYAPALMTGSHNLKRA